MARVTGQAMSHVRVHDIKFIQGIKKAFFFSVFDIILEKKIKL
jgi:hypothetical protein